MSDFKKIQEIKDKIAIKERQDIENKALQKKILQDLKENYDLDSLEAATKYIDKLKKQLNKNASKLQGQYDDFINKHSDSLGIY